MDFLKFSCSAAKENPQILSMINNNWELMIPSDAGARRDADRVKVLAKQLKELYFNDQEVSEESILDYCTVGRKTLTFQFFCNG